MPDQNNCVTCQVCVTCQGQEQVMGTGCANCFTCQAGIATYPPQFVPTVPMLPTTGMPNYMTPPGTGVIGGIMPNFPRPMMPPPNPNQVYPKPQLVGECLNCSERLDNLLKSVEKLIGLLEVSLGGDQSGAAAKEQ